MTIKIREKKEKKRRGGQENRRESIPTHPIRSVTCSTKFQFSSTTKHQKKKETGEKRSSKKYKLVKLEREREKRGGSPCLPFCVVWNIQESGFGLLFLLIRILFISFVIFFLTFNVRWWKKRNILFHRLHPSVKANANDQMKIKKLNFTSQTKCKKKNNNNKRRGEG